jgi:hypothetical protein
VSESLTLGNSGSGGGGGAWGNLQWGTVLLRLTWLPLHRWFCMCNGGEHFLFSVLSRFSSLRLTSLITQPHLKYPCCLIIKLNLIREKNELLSLLYLRILTESVTTTLNTHFPASVASSTAFTVVRNKACRYRHPLYKNLSNDVISLVNRFSGICGTSSDSLSNPTQFIVEHCRAHSGTLLGTSWCSCWLYDNFICSSYVSYKMAAVPGFPDAITMYFTNWIWVSTERVKLKEEQEVTR